MSIFNDGSRDFEQWQDRARAEAEQLTRARQSLAGWRWALDYARELIGDLAMLKGAQAHRGRIDTARFEIGQALGASDMAVLRHTTATADVAIALAEADRAFPDRPWLFGRGRSEPGSGAYGFAVFASADAAEPIAEVTDDDPRACVRRAAEQLNGGQRREQ